MDNKRIRKQRLTLWTKDPRCRYCGTVTILPENLPFNKGQKTPENMATIDHFFPRTRPNEKLSGGNKWVLSCSQCNSIKGTIEGGKLTYSQKLIKVRRWEMVEIDPNGTINSQSLLQQILFIGAAKEDGIEINTESRPDLQVAIKYVRDFVESAVPNISYKKIVSKFSTEILKRNGYSDYINTYIHLDQLTYWLLNNIEKIKNKEI